MKCVFSNDNNVELILLEKHDYSAIFSKRYYHEVIFRRIHSYLIKEDIIDGNIIDLGSWIGDNTLPWAKQINGTVYAIDPSPDNINFIDKMCKINNINNVIPIQAAICDRNEVLYTNDQLHHCSFNNNDGKTKVNAYSLDYLHDTGVIDKIEYIHLDVEGLEEKVIRGATKLIDKYKPIISFEQHLSSDDYITLSAYLCNKGYFIYLINEILPGCNYDCRNLMAFPRKIDIDNIHNYLQYPALLLVCQPGECEILYSTTIYGDHISRIHNNVLSYKHYSRRNLHLFPIHDDNYTKIIAIDDLGNWVDGRHIMGRLNISDSKLISTAYDSSYMLTHTKREYNIRNIKSLND